MIAVQSEKPMTALILYDETSHNQISSSSVDPYILTAAFMSAGPEYAQYLPS
jgi:hypothetical protein